MSKNKPIGKKLKKFSMETRLKSTKEFKIAILKKFGDYIKSIIVWGSITRGDYTGKSDVDIYIIFDDTKASIKDFNKIRERIDKDIYKIAHDIDPRLHPQPILALTEFMDGIRFCHPLFYNIIREGFALHDTGFFIPMRKLLEWGHFPATKEAAEMRMESVPKRITRVENVKLYIIAEDLYYAFLDSAQAILMYLGVGPPSPKVAVRELREHLVSKGLLDEKYAKMLEDVLAFRKAVEHKEIKKIESKEVDKWIAKAEEYIKVFEALLKKLELNRKAYDIKSNYEIMIKTVVSALKSINKLPKEPAKMPEAFKKHLIETGVVNPVYANIFNKVIEMRKLLEEKNIEEIPIKEIYANKEYVKRFVNEIKMNLMEKLNFEKNAEEKMKKAEDFVDTTKSVEKIKELKKSTKAKKTEKLKEAKAVKKIKISKKETEKSTTRMKK